MQLYEHQKQVLEKIRDKNKCALYLDMGLRQDICSIRKNETIK